MIVHSTQVLLALLTTACSAFAQTLPTLTPTPSPSSIPWSTKIDTLRAYILTHPEQNATKGFWNGPSLQLTFPDTSCLQVRFYNWDCFFDIPYKMRGVVAYLDSINARDMAPITDTYRFYTYGYYVDPDNGWRYYDEARLSFGACGNRGPQSSCGVGWCVDQNGNGPGWNATFVVPEGESPYVDPNSRDNICPWLKNGTSAHK
ncbi:hypothetical protein EK21DRAFT_61695 [Setomelanomma holmii]|uniref:Uncharacterized protein n=1 Tax=Setomelanomma holmii TaxID=210430 RepID=A0A9P4HBT5_9PLEO|nr:hypothetical protein EK21DRAFT_61695 [Setomelanomma holmii]